MWSAAVSLRRRSASAAAASRARVARTALCTMSLRFAFDRDVNEQTEDSLLMNSGGKAARNAFWRSPVAPTLLVIITTHWVKSTTRPRESVSLPSSSNCNNTLITAEWAFSISSSSTTQKGRLRTASVSCPPLSWPTYPGGAPTKRLTECASEYSLMSSRTKACFGSSNSSDARALAVSVFPTPVGPQNRNEPSGASGRAKPARARTIAADTSSNALSWPTTRSFRRCAKASSLDRSLSANLETGTPVQRATTAATSSTVTTSDTILSSESTSMAFSASCCNFFSSSGIAPYSKSASRS
mmetsp:Transcript_23138/g.64878  ORF Transcript_23138/g.64878 Transcript_23138/m.64878 type:complete len:299 (+) Transcript_23138:302-1198(+)